MSLCQRGLASEQFSGWQASAEIFLIFFPKSLFFYSVEFYHNVDLRLELNQFQGMPAMVALGLQDPFDKPVIRYLHSFCCGCLYVQLYLHFDLHLP